MSGKFLARASALSFAIMLTACGGDEASTPIVNVNTDTPQTSTDTTDNSTGDSGAPSGETTRSLALGSSSGSSFIEGEISASTTSLGSGGDAYLEVTVVNASDGNSPVTGESMDVSFSSGCLDTQKASLSANPVTISSGIARTTYTAKGCTQDVVTATVNGAAAEASVLLNIAAAEAVDLIASAPTPNSIAPKGQATESRKSLSKVTFTLEDADENGVPGSQVTFTLFPSTTNVSLIETSATTNDAGQVVATVEAGTTNEIVRVVASTTSASGAAISTTSAPIAVNSYIPTDANFSMSFSRHILNAMGIDGVETEVMISAADRYGDAIRGNTIVNFTTSNGSITPDCVLDDTGKCTVIWSSLATREARPKIYAYTQGERLVSGTDCYLPTSNCTYEPATIDELGAIVQSSSDGVEALLTNPAGNEYCVSTFVFVGGGVSVAPPAGTTIEFTATAGSILNETQASKTINDDPDLVPEPQYTTCVNAAADATYTEPPRLNVVITPPDGDPVEEFISLL